MGKLREISDKVSEFTDKHGIANPIEVADEALGGQTREESKARREKLKEKAIPKTPQPTKQEYETVDTTLGIPGIYRPATKDEIDGAVKRANEKKNKGMKAGGKVKSASARADGCAIRGKTRA
jgi:hypothetical protein